MEDLCVIFDLDGTLVDSEASGQQALLDLLPEFDDTVESLVSGTAVIGWHRC
jgi:beta-phosphoglucomutase-like phosphatase (HAD superfamily)